MRSMALRPQVVHGREARLPAPIDLGPNVGRRPSRLDLSADGIGVVARVGQHDSAGGQPFEQRCAGLAVGGLSAG